MKARPLGAALADIEEAARYYEDQQPGLGDRFLDVVEDALKRIEASPDGFSFLETLPTSLGYRRVILTPF